MSKLIKRKDGSYSKRGLWDNIRANKGSGKKPTKDMLKQETKIKKEENMKSMYKKGGKPSKKSSFMEESKEINFDAPRKYEKGGPGKGLFEKIKDTQEALKKAPSSAGPREKENYQLILKEREKMKNLGPDYSIDRGIEKSVFFNSVEDAERAQEVDNLMLKNARKFSPASKKTGGKVETGMDVVARGNRAQGKATMAGKKMRYKTGGVKKYNNGGLAAGAMEGAGAGLAAINNKMKKGAMPSELDNDLQSGAFDIGQNTLMARKGGAMSKFKTMAAAGKKKMMGGKKC